MKSRLLAYAVSATSLLILSACGGSGGIPSNTSVTGLVAVGAALPYPSVLITDAIGSTKTVTGDALGGYTFDTTGMQAPFVIKAAGVIGTQEYNLVSILPTAATGSKNTAQVTPLTTAIAALVNASNNYNADTLTPSNISPAAVTAATNALTSALSAPIAAAGLSSSFNPITETFDANRTGADQVLDIVDVRIKPTGVILANRLEVLNNNADPSNLTLTSVGSSGVWPAGVNPAGQALLDLQNKIKACFALPAAERAPGASADSGGFISADISQIHTSCKNYVVNSYMQNTYSYGERWGAALSSTDILNAEVVVNLKYVLARAGTADGNVYVVNINFKDINGNWYTRPEVLERTTTSTSDTFAFFGNRRTLDFSIDPNYTYIDDLSTPTNSRVEGRLQFNTTPHRAKPSGGNYQFFYDVTDASLAQPKIICAWITGPLVQTGAAHDVDNPKGGVLVKIPHPDVVATRNYMPIHAKYSADFDPINNTSTPNNDRQTLFNDCKSTTGTNVKVGTSNTNNQFTFSAARSRGASTWSYPGASSNNFVISRDNVSICNSNTTTATDGCPRRYYTNIRSTEVSAQDQIDYLNLYGNTSMPRFTVYAFQDDSYLNAEFTNQTPDHNVWSNSISNFWNSKIIETGRLIAPMAFVDRDANGVYSGDIKFRKPDDATVASYLGQTMATLPAATNVNVGWTVPSGAQGIDRFGGRGQAYYTSNGTEKVIVSSIAQISKGASRSSTSGTLILSDEWLGNAAIGSTKNYSGTNFAVTSVYREIWARSYDLENRQIQYVYTRKN